MAIFFEIIISLNLILIILVLLAVSKTQQTFESGKKSDAHKNSAKFSKNLEKKLEEDIEKLISVAEKKLDSALSGYFQRLVDDAVKKGAELADFIEKQQGTIVKETQFLVARDVEDLKKQLDAYRNQKFAEIDQRVSEMVSTVSKQILGKVIDTQAHEDLVKSALERAKKERFLENG